jgi:2-succinyl-5-enolpyruvyl-6-hydroxy-3-cyclohexene-1-carboxylate synthase
VRVDLGAVVGERSLAARRLGLKLTIVLLENGGGGIFDFLAVSRSQMALARPAAAGAAGAEAERAPDGEAERVRDGETERVRDGEDIYTRHVATPTGLDFARAAALYGLSYERVEDVFAFRSALERSLDAGQDSSIIEVRGERKANVELHRRIWQAVSRSLSPPKGEAGPTA